jgi:hypothetical protein
VDLKDPRDPKMSRDFKREVTFEHDTRRRFICIVLECRFVKFIIPKLIYRTQRLLYIAVELEAF